jgi:hypothetical protein
MLLRDTVHDPKTPRRAMASTGWYIARRGSKLVRYVCVLMIFLLILSFLPARAPNVDRTDSNNSFSIMQITDTQYLSDFHPSLYAGLIRWVVNNAQAYNLQMVVHTGDIVQDDYATGEWTNANAAMLTLLDNNIPYLWCAGNHDQLHSNRTSSHMSGDPNGVWLGHDYAAFNQTVAEAKPYWLSDIYQGKDTAVQFSVGNYDFLIIDLEYEANSTAIAWMENLITAHPSCNIIVATHGYLESSANYIDDWAQNLSNRLNNYPNVFMTLNGHYTSGTAAHKTVSVATGKERTEIFFNRQEVDGETGADSVRIYTFNMNSNEVTVSTKIVYNNTFLDDPADTFNFSTNLTPSTSVPEFPSTLMLTLFMIAALLAVVLSKKRPRHVARAR